jgi:hypothetical protein
MLAPAVYLGVGILGFSPGKSCVGAQSKINWEFRVEEETVLVTAVVNNRSF